MESAQTEIVPVPHSPDFTHRYRINTRVAGVKKDGARWFILFDGSWEWLGLDTDQPNLTIGDKVCILIQKA